MDPTRNVLDLVRAAVARIDDMADLRARLADEKFHSMEREAIHLTAVSVLRADHAREIRMLESDRLDKIRQVDQQNVTTAAERALAAIQTLDRTTQANAETLRAMVQSTATAIAKQCVSTDTLILCADLVWRKAGDLAVGDELVAFDEECQIQPGKRVSRGRQYRKSVVTSNAIREDDLLLVTTPRGRVRCNAEHPWLARRSNSHRGGGWHWIETKDLTPGDEVLHVFDVWEVDRSYDAGWLAGIMDGEGCLIVKADKGGITARLNITQVVGSTAERIGAVLTDKIGSFNAHLRPAKVAGGKDSEGFHRGERKAKMEYDISTRSGIVRALGMIRPGRLMEMADQIWEGCYIGGDNRATNVTSVESVGRGHIASLATSTKTYIAGGFAMHNTSDAMAAVTERIAALEKSSYTGMGRAGVADPQMAEMISEMKTFRAMQVQSAGKSEGSGDAVKWAALAVSVVVGLIAIGSFFFVTMRSGVEPAPQIIYVPAPATGVPLPTTPQVGR